MEYKGKLYGKVGSSYFPLLETTDDVEALKGDQRQLLIDFFAWFRDNGEDLIGLTIEQFVDEYLKDRNE